MKVYKLNGFWLFLDGNEYSNLSHIIVYSKVGSRYEDRAGITHFLEHNLFKGSKNYNYHQINEFFELYGNSIDAGTNKESLVIYTSILNQKLFEALNIIFDIILNPTFEGYENEKNVIIQEYKETLDNYEERSYYYLNKAIFKSHPLSKEILGTLSNIKNFNKEDLIRRKNEVFSKDNVILVISGHFSEDEILKFVEDNFALKFEYKLKLKQFKNYKPSKITKKHNGFNSYITMGIPVFDYKPLKLSLLLASQMLGGGSSSILFDRIREKNGLVYDIHTFLDFYSEVAVFSISYSVEKRYFEKVILEIERILKNLKNYLNNFEIYKQKLKTSIIIDFEFRINYLFYVVNEYLISGEIADKEKVLRDVENLKLDDFLRVIEIIKNFENYSFGIVI